MDPLLLQKQLKNNNQDVLDFCKDLKTWGEEMRQKEQKLQSKNKFQNNTSVSKDTFQKKEQVKKEKTELKAAKKCMTYADWEKFDAEEECAKVDEDSDSELTDEMDETLKEEALVQKEAGNRHVKNGNWDEAIKCYTKAIEYYAYDPVFYANRALCHLKKNEMTKTEADCTVSLKLDNTYVKAYQRRAAARESMNKLEEAKLDLMRVLELEPKNTESKNNLEKLKLKIGSVKKVESSESQRPISQFSASRQQKRGDTNVNNTSTSTKIDVEKPQPYWPSGDHVALVKPIKKPPHMRSKKPLKRIKVQEINSAIPNPKIEEDTRWPKKGSDPKIINIEDMKIIERTPVEKIQNVTSPGMNKEAKNMCNFDKILNCKVEVEPELDIELEAPKTSVQFHLIWKKLKGKNDKRCEYLKLLNPERIPVLFRESLESQTFSDILHVLSEYFVKNNENVYEYLVYLSRIQRFATLTMFLSLSDKNCLWKLVNYMKESGRSKDEVEELIAKYELQ